MEKFYIVTDKSSLNKDYWKYKNNIKEVNKYVKEFLAKEGINAKYYGVETERLYIIPTERDIARLAGKLTKPLDNGLRSFKTNSVIGKRWIKFVRDNNIKILYKPTVGFYFNAFGKSASRLFDIEDILYCSYESEFDFENPCGFMEIKASEFFKAIENGM